MFDIGFLEILFIGVVALVVIGPAELPQAIRATIDFIGKAKQFFAGIKRSVEVELGTEEIKREIHNASIVSLFDQHNTTVLEEEKKAVDNTVK
ncbi:MAG: sec-independent protein translocase protein TatB [Paraglaciecola sp.]|jgi:sec-independent protein translocase protein TatB